MLMNRSEAAMAGTEGHPERTPGESDYLPVFLTVIVWVDFDQGKIP